MVTQQGGATVSLPKTFVYNIRNEGHKKLYVKAWAAWAGGIETPGL